MRTLTPLQAQRFWAKVDVSTPDMCWGWLGKPGPSSGYGRCCFDYQIYLSHRVAYSLAREDLSRGQVVMHTCDNPMCCNPAHLLAGTPDDNSKDMVKKGRQARRISDSERASRVVWAPVVAMHLCDHASRVFLAPVVAMQLCDQASRVFWLRSSRCACATMPRWF